MTYHDAPPERVKEMMMIKALELAYARVQVPDLDRAEQFFHDFGLLTRSRSDDRLYLHGTGPEHHLIVAHRGERRLLGLAFLVRDANDLVTAASLDGTSVIEDIGEPGGGRRVTLADPDGNCIELVHGIATTDPLPLLAQHFNSASGRDRRRNTIVRPTKGPSHVMRIGHVVMRTPQVERLRSWYQHMLGLIASDDVTLPDGGTDLLMSFLRLDQGDVAVDHHAFQAFKGPPNQLHHISFEVQDFDDLQMGHAALGAAGYRQMWGIGRHVQGSQIFDYWLDPFGTMYEHWTDSDRLDATVPTVVISAEEMGDPTPWGPAMPDAFMHHGTA